MKTGIVSFYSYKGGAGRTTTAVNTIPYIAEKLGADKNNPVLVVDMDLESAGITYFYDLQDRFLKFQMQTSTSFDVLRSNEYLGSPVRVKRLFGTSTQQEIPLDPECIQILKERVRNSGLDIDVLGNLSIKRSLSELLKQLVKAEKNGSSEEKARITSRFNINELCQTIHDHRSYPEQVKQLIEEILPTSELIDISYIYKDFEPGTIKFLGIDDTTQDSVEHNSGASAIELLAAACRSNNFKAIIFDSGSGRQSSAHALHLTSDVMVYCMRPTSQFRIGTLNNISYYNNTFRDKLRQKVEDGGECKKNIILLPTAVPEESYGYAERVFKDIEQGLCNLYPDYIDSSFCSHVTALCEVNTFKWEESILYKKGELDDDQARAVKTYEKLAEVICNNL